MPRNFKLALIGLSCLALAGCQSSPLLGGIFRGKDRPELAEKARTTASKNALADAREDLRAGNIAAAIANFQIASANPELRGDASNGLGVAWAMLGRHDVAERYFIAALQQQPGNDMYLANLMRLQSVAPAQRNAMVRPEPIAAPASPTLTASAVAGSGMKDDGLSGAAVRISPNEILIRSGPQNAPPARMAVEYGRGTDPRIASRNPSAKTSTSAGPAEPAQIPIIRK